MARRGLAAEQVVFASGKRPVGCFWGCFRRVLARVGALCGDLDGLRDGLEDPVGRHHANIYCSGPADAVNCEKRTSAAARAASGALMISHNSWGRSSISKVRKLQHACSLRTISWMRWTA